MPHHKVADLLLCTGRLPPLFVFPPVVSVSCLVAASHLATHCMLTGHYSLFPLWLLVHPLGLVDLILPALQLLFYYITKPARENKLFDKVKKSLQRNFKTLST